MPLAAPPGPFTSISAGWKSTCALTQSGFAQCWEYPAPVRPAPPYDRLNLVNASPGHLFSQPTEVFAWPAGGLAVADRTGFISIYAAGSEPSLVLDLSDIVDSGGSLNGMLSAAVDPEFSEFSFLYVYYTIRDEQQGGKESTRLTRFPVVDGQAVREEELLILETPMLPRPTYGYEGSSHYGGSIRFGPDGMLYLGIGDSHCFKCPQSLETLHGKIIRIDVHDASAQNPYRVPEDNPFVGTPNARPEIWAYGLRNPYRMAFDPRDGRLWVRRRRSRYRGRSDDRRCMGANLGWPFSKETPASKVASLLPAITVDTVVYGCNEIEGLTAPISTYELSKETCAIIGGVVYRGAAIPWLDGAYLLATSAAGMSGHSTATTRLVGEQSRLQTWTGRSLRLEPTRLAKCTCFRLAARSYV